jgi:hypothetical protein
MKLEYLQPEDYAGTRKGDPRISFSSTGTIRLNTKAMLLADFTDTATIAIAKDADDGQYYLIPHPDSGAFKLNFYKGRGKGAGFYALALVLKIRKDYNLPFKKTNSLLISTNAAVTPDGKLMYPILNSEK